MQEDTWVVGSGFDCRKLTSPDGLQAIAAWVDVPASSLTTGSVINIRRHSAPAAALRVVCDLRITDVYTCDTRTMVSAECADSNMCDHNKQDNHGNCVVLEADLYEDCHADYIESGYVKCVCGGRLTPDESILPESVSCPRSGEKINLRYYAEDILGRQVM